MAGPLEEKHPKVFSVYFSPPHFGRREHLSMALSRYAGEFERIAAAAERARNSVPSFVEAVLPAFDAREDELELEVICFVGLYERMAFASRPRIARGHSSPWNASLATPPLARMP